MSEVALLRAMFDAAVASALPARCVAGCLPEVPTGRLVVIGAGKAAAAMARAAEVALLPAAGDRLSGVVVTRAGYEVACERIEVLTASHPVPNAASVAAADRLLAAVRGVRAEDRVLMLLSGGASALLCRPADGLSFADKRAVHEALLRCGASISEMNCVRRHLSGIKGGRLAAACWPAPVTTLAMSDVPGDDLLDIGSGPTVADPTSCADALAVVRRYDIALPAAALALLAAGAGESVKPGDARLAGHEVRLVATPRMALQAAARVAEAAGVRPVLLGDRIEGEAREVARVMAGIALSAAAHGEPAAAPCVLLSGGETSVTVRGDGTGGRNVEFLLALAIALRGRAGIYALAADTDGVDGGAEVAGAWIGPETLEHARALGIDPAEALARNDGHSFFAALGQQIITGPTLTNVNDFRAILIV